jgi:hypothetical protein
MGKSKSRFMLVEKEEIVRVAFSSPQNIKASNRTIVWRYACKHSVLGKKPRGGKVGTLAINF